MPLCVTPELCVCSKAVQAGKGGKGKGGKGKGGKGKGAGLYEKR